MKTLVIANQKGGTGKSTVACHVAHYFAEQGLKVAFINCETQGNSCKTLKKTFAVAPVKTGAFFQAEPIQLPLPEGFGDPGNNLLVFEGGGYLSDVSNAQAKYFPAHIQAIAPHFDLCVIDTPPTTTVLQVSALIAADHVLSPIELEEYSIDGVTDMLKVVVGVKQRYNPKMNFLGILPNRLRGTSTRQKSALESLLTQYPQYMFSLTTGTRIGERQAIPEALSLGLPVWQHKKGSDAAEEMLGVMRRIAEKAEMQ